MLNEKINLAIMYGGPGGEHEVSIKSAKNILQGYTCPLGENIDLNKYEVKEFFLNRDVKIIPGKFLKELKSFLGNNGIVWPIFHGEFGEGGYVQEVLEKNKMKFIGSGSQSSQLAIDKFKTQKVLEKNGIFCPRTLVVSSSTPKLNGFSFPIILKPVNSGSSVDLFKVLNMKELEIALELLLKKYKRVLLQEFVVGREFTCGVMNIKRKVVALPITEIVLNKSEVFDYNAKYSIGGCLEITPAKIDKKISTRMQNIAKKVHKIVGCKDVTRTDMILDKNGKLYVLEINTIPGMTKGSLVPQQLTCAGITIPEFIDIMVENNIK